MCLSTGSLSSSDLFWGFTPKVHIFLLWTPSRCRFLFMTGLCLCSISISCLQAFFLHCCAVCIWPLSQPTARQHCYIWQILISACEQFHQVSHGYLLFLVYCRLVVPLSFHPLTLYPLQIMSFWKTHRNSIMHRIFVLVWCIIFYMLAVMLVVHHS